MRVRVGVRGRVRGKDGAGVRGWVGVSPVRGGVPIAVERLDSVVLSCTLTPKSASLSAPARVSRKLAALRSRCSMWQSWCRCCSAHSAPAATAATCGSLSGAPRKWSESSNEPA